MRIQLQAGDTVADGNVSHLADKSGTSSLKNLSLDHLEGDSGDSGDWLKTHIGETDVLNPWKEQAFAPPELIRRHTIGSFRDLWTTGEPELLNTTPTSVRTIAQILGKEKKDADYQFVLVGDQRLTASKCTFEDVYTSAEVFAGVAEALETPLRRPSLSSDLFDETCLTEILGRRVPRFELHSSYAEKYNVLDLAFSTLIYKEVHLRVLEETSHWNYIEMALAFDDRRARHKKSSLLTRIVVFLVLMTDSRWRSETPLGYYYRNQSAQTPDPEERSVNEVFRVLLLCWTKLRVGYAKLRVHSRAPPRFLLLKHTRANEEARNGASSTFCLRPSKKSGSVANIVSKLRREGWKQGVIEDLREQIFSLRKYCPLIIELPFGMTPRCLKKSELIKMNESHMVVATVAAEVLAQIPVDGAQRKRPADFPELPPNFKTYIAQNEAPKRHLIIANTASGHLPLITSMVCEEKNLEGVTITTLNNKLDMRTETLSASNVSFLKQRIDQLTGKSSRKSLGVLDKARVILLNVDCSKSAICNPASYYLDEKQGAGVLRNLESQLLADSPQEILMQHKVQLLHCLTLFPKVDTIIYVTNSAFRSENELLVTQTLSEFNSRFNSGRDFHFKIVDMREKLAGVRVEESAKGFMKINPHNNMNGTFIAVIHRTKLTPSAVDILNRAVETGLLLKNEVSSDSGHESDDSDKQKSTRIPSSRRRKEKLKTRTSSKSLMHDATKTELETKDSKSSIPADPAAPAEASMAPLSPLKLKRKKSSTSVSTESDREKARIAFLDEWIEKQHAMAKNRENSSPKMRKLVLNDEDDDFFSGLGCMQFESPRVENKESGDTRVLEMRSNRDNLMKTDSKARSHDPEYSKALEKYSEQKELESEHITSEDKPLTLGRSEDLARQTVAMSFQRSPRSARQATTVPAKLAVQVLGDDSRMKVSQRATPRSFSATQIQGSPRSPDRISRHSIASRMSLASRLTRYNSNGSSGSSRERSSPGRLERTRQLEQKMAALSQVRNAWEQVKAGGSQVSHVVHQSPRQEERVLRMGQSQQTEAARTLTRPSVQNLGVVTRAQSLQNIEPAAFTNLNSDVSSVNNPAMKASFRGVKLVYSGRSRSLNSFIQTSVDTQKKTAQEKSVPHANAVQHLRKSQSSARESRFAPASQFVAWQNRIKHSSPNAGLRGHSVNMEFKASAKSVIPEPNPAIPLEDEKMENIVQHRRTETEIDKRSIPAPSVIGELLRKAHSRSGESGFGARAIYTEISPPRRTQSSSALTDLENLKRRLSMFQPPLKKADAPSVEPSQENENEKQSTPESVASSEKYRVALKPTKPKELRLNLISPRTSLSLMETVRGNTPNLRHRTASPKTVSKSSSFSSSREPTEVEAPLWSPETAREAEEILETRRSSRVFSGYESDRETKDKVAPKVPIVKYSARETSVRNRN